MPTDPRTRALLRLLDDWEAERLTPTRMIPPQTDRALRRSFMTAVNHWACMGLSGLTLTPAGLAAARAAKENAP